MLLLLEIFKLFAFLGALVLCVLAAIGFLIAVPIAWFLDNCCWWGRVLLALGLLLPFPLCLWLVIHAASWAGLN